MDKGALLRKIRLLTLASIASAKIGRDVPYAEVASALQVQDSEVETWAIDGTLLDYDTRQDISHNFCSHKTQAHRRKAFPSYQLDSYYPLVYTCLRSISMAGSRDTAGAVEDEPGRSFKGDRTGPEDSRGIECDHGAGCCC
jgi:hypothetical protein